jgi:ubiquinone/menaquinone biosynthesis C-methylase UbiE
MAKKQSKTTFIINAEFAQRSNKAFYDNYYSNVSDTFIRWRDYGALGKCESIVSLGQHLKPSKVVEIGCGLCSITSRLDKLNFAPEFYGIEVSSSALDFIKEKLDITNLKTVYLLDTSRTPFDDAFFDLGILSHVLEHVHDPKALIIEALRICKHVVIEVPLEDCLLPNLLAIYENKIKGLERKNNSAGHIHFFNKQTISCLVMESGGKILNERTYRPWKIFNDGVKKFLFLQYFKSIVLFLMFKLTGSRLVWTNYAMLVTNFSSHSAPAQN